MIIGIGMDTVHIPRIEELYKRYGTKLLQKVLTLQELDLITSASNKKTISHLAKRFAAKEALVKAIGTGFSRGISLQDIEIFNNQAGKPYYALNKKIEDYIILYLSGNKKFTTHLTLSDEYPIAAAFTIIEC